MTKTMLTDTLTNREEQAAAFHQSAMFARIHNPQGFHVILKFKLMSPQNI